MIQKNFFQTWVGDEIPKSAVFSFNSFKNMNPDFCCDFVSFSVDAPGDWATRLPDFNKAVNRDIPKMKKNMNVALLLRYYLIQEYGGIFCDSDMFPIRPFDNKLLSLTGCFKMSKTRPDRVFISDDAGFMGCEKGTKSWAKRYLLAPMELYDYDNPEFLRLREKFFDGTLQLGEHFNDPKYCYVDHYDGNTLNKETYRADNQQ